MMFPENDINSDALNYWRVTGYTSAQIDEYCRRWDGKFMMAKVQFTPGQAPVVTVSDNCWRKQEGHYGTIVQFFDLLCATERGSRLSGEILLHLEDGIYEHHRFITRTVPLIGFGRSRSDSIAMIMPDPAFLGSAGYLSELEKISELEKARQERKKPTLYWRGSATGTAFDNERWIFAPRARLVLAAQKLANREVIDALLTKIDFHPEQQQKALRDSGVVGEYTDFYDFLKYRYLIDVDGYHCAWRSLFLKLGSGSVVVKVESELEQWYHRRLKPWYHYVPLAADCSDIQEVYEWLIAHKEYGQEIVHNANLLVKSVTIENEVERFIMLCEQLISFKRS